MYIGTPFLLNNTCTVSRKTTSSDGWGNPKTSGYSTVSTNTRCRLMDNLKQEVIDGKVIAISKPMLYMRRGADVQIADRITIGIDVYTVEAINPNPGNSNHHVEVALLYVKE